MNWWMIFQWALLGVSIPAVIFFVTKWNQGRVHYAYSIVLISGFVWSLGQQLENCVILYWQDEAALRGALYLCYAGMTVIGAACVYLSWCYAGKYKMYRSKGRVIALFGTGACFYPAVLTNDFHHLYYVYLSVSERTYGVLFYLFTVFSYVCFIYACVVMVRSRLDMDRSPLLMMLFCFVPPVAANTFGMIVKNPAFDFTPAAYCALILAGYFIIWRKRPVNLAPIAAKQIFDSINCPVRVINPDGNKIYNNGVNETDGRVYQKTATVLHDKNTLEIFTDITEYDTARRDLTAKREALERSYILLKDQEEKLLNQAKIANEVAATRANMEITAAMDKKVRGNLEQLWLNTTKLAENPECGKIEKNRMETLKILEAVREIVNGISKETRR